MRATVYYVTLTREQQEQLELGGWESAIGKAYQAAKAGDYSTAAARALLRPTAILSRASREHIWRDLQNVDSAWYDRRTLLEIEPVDSITCRSLRRSMDLGDVIHWQDGRAEVCADVGFRRAALRFTETGAVVV